MTTIIVMLILVVVTIRISTKGGLFDYAGRAARETNDAIEEETDLANGKITIGGVTYDSIDEYISKLTKNANNWDLAYVCNSGAWSKEITDKNDAALTASDIIIAKFYKTGNKITPTLDGATLDEGDAYELVIEGTGAMGDLARFVIDIEYVKYAWQQSTITPYITKLVISKGITNIPDFAFAECTSLTEIAIPTSVTSIGEAAFMGCTSLTEIAIPTSVTSIGAGAFIGCTSLTEIAIPTSVTNIPDFAFAACTSLTEIAIPTSVTSIGVGAFAGCTSLTEIAIPTSVTSIGAGAFMGCTSLTEITYNGTTAQWDSITKDRLLEYKKTVIVHCTDGDITLYYEEVKL